MKRTYYKFVASEGLFFSAKMVFFYTDIDSNDVMILPRTWYIFLLCFNIDCDIVYGKLYIYILSCMH